MAAESILREKIHNIWQTSVVYLSATDPFCSAILEYAALGTEFDSTATVQVENSQQQFQHSRVIDLEGIASIDVNLVYLVGPSWISSRRI